MPRTTRSRVLPIVGAVVGLLVVAGGIAYAVKPDKAVPDAGKVVGFTPAPAPTVTVLKLKPVTGRAVLFFGDSWTGGVGASDPAKNSYAALTIAALHLRGPASKYVEYKSGAGLYPHDGGPSLAQVFSDEPTVSPAPGLVVVEGGQNDRSHSEGQIESSLTTLLGEIRARYRSAQVVVLGPTAPTPATDAETARVSAAMSIASRSAKVPYIDTTGEKWFTDDDRLHRFINLQVGHPSDAGYQRLSAYLIRDLQQLGAGLGIATS